jgi:hypothetical protein
MQKIKVLIILLILLSNLSLTLAIPDTGYRARCSYFFTMYTGTPPFWINIRQDTNIGQPGGYLWALTNSNYFIYDMNFAINPSKKFYYGVKDQIGWSETKNFEIENFSDCRWNFALNGIPKFVNTNYIPLDKIERISKFRSTAGHVYSDFYENCTSMKHYFIPLGEGGPGQQHYPSWSNIDIISPINGTIISKESAKTTFNIRSDQYPSFQFIIFHINESSDLKVGDHVYEGQLLGKHDGDMVGSDIAIEVFSSENKLKLISYFDVMTDSLFQTYKQYGINNRSDIIISKEQREQYPMQCNGDAFTIPDPIGTAETDQWVILQH